MMACRAIFRLTDSANWIERLQVWNRVKAYIRDYAWGYKLEYERLRWVLAGICRAVVYGLLAISIESIENSFEYTTFIFELMHLGHLKVGLSTIN